MGWLGGNSGKVSKEEKFRQLWISGQLWKEERASRISNLKSLPDNTDVGKSTLAPSTRRPAKDEKLVSFGPLKSFRKKKEFQDSLTQSLWLGLHILAKISLHLPSATLERRR